MREIINRYKKEVIMGVVVSLITTVVIKVWDWVILVAPTTGKNLIHTIDNLTYAIAATQSSSSLLIMLIGCIMGAIAFPVVFAVFVSMRSFINATISVKKNGQTKTGDSSLTDKHAEEVTAAQQKEKMVKQGKYMGICALITSIPIVLVYISVSTFIVRPAGLQHEFENDITMIAPYVSESEILQLKSDWVCMKNKTDYDEIYATIDQVIEENTLPN